LSLASKLCFSGGSCPTAADENGKCQLASGSSDSESFTINSTNPLALVFTVAASSNYAADVAAAAIPSSATSPVIEFTSASAGVDCSASDSWTLLTFQSRPDVTACMAMEEELNNWQSGETCANQESQDKAGDAPPAP
jgi:hypothetical protein